MMGLTRKQSQALEFIRSFIAANRQPPSLGEIAEGMGCSERSRARAGEVVRALEERGYLRRIPYRARSIELIEPDDTTIKLSPQVERAVSEYARRHRTTTQVAANELLAEYLAKVAA